MAWAVICLSAVFAVSGAAAQTWDPGTEITLPGNAATNPGAEAFPVACPAAEPCVAIGSYEATSMATEPFGVIETGGVWAPASEIGPPAGVTLSGNGPTFDALACPASGS